MASRLKSIARWRWGSAAWLKAAQTYASDTGFVPHLVQRCGQFTRLGVAIVQRVLQVVRARQTVGRIGLPVIYGLVKVTLTVTLGLPGAFAVTVSR